MPIPRNNFTARFEAAKTDILAYFEFARDIAFRFSNQLTTQKLLEESGARRPSLNKKASRICFELANEMGCSPAYINQCKVSARAFSRELVDQILSDCEAARHVPTQEFFIALTRIPMEERRGWIEAATNEHWSASRIKEESKRVYGVRSNGGKEPMRPRSLPEALSKFDAAYARLNSVFERLREVQVGVSEGPQGVSFRVPRSLMSKISESRTALDALRKGLTGVSQPVRRRAA